MPGLSNELRQKLAQIRPETLGQASRIEGMTPAGLAILAFNARAARRGAAQQGKRMRPPGECWIVRSASKREPMTGREFAEDATRELSRL